jgi:hypothetical protein
MYFPSISAMRLSTLERPAPEAFGKTAPAGLTIARRPGHEMRSPIVRGPELLGADSFFIDEPGERRAPELEDGAAGAADLGAVAGPAFGLAKRTLHPREFVLASGTPHGAIGGVRVRREQPPAGLARSAVEIGWFGHGDPTALSVWSVRSGQ